MKTLIVDIEISLDIIATYGLREQYHRPENILQNWFMICFAWEWLDGEEPHVYSLLNDRERFKADPTDDYAVVAKLHKVLSTADVIVGHNVGRFDWKKFMARVMYHGLPPIPKPQIVDTLVEAKKLAYFTSNKLSYLAKYLKVEHKMHHSGDMWLRIIRGDRAAIKECAEYCKGDIRATKAMYLKIRPYMENHPNANLWRAGGIECCTQCAGENLTKAGIKTNRTGRWQRWKCGNCGAHMQSTKRIKGAQLK